MIGKALKTNRCLVEQAISYFLLIGVSKQKLLFSSMVFYFRSAESFFHVFHKTLCNTRPIARIFLRGVIR